MGTMLEEREAQMKKSLGIYVHIPFCVRKCAYCDFLSQVGDANIQQQYCKCLLQEMKQAQSWADGYQVDTIFLGGGTPSILEPKWIDQILDSIYRIFSIRQKNKKKDSVLQQRKTGLEVTIECNPGTLTQEKARIYQAAGVNRVSLGLQSAVATELELLGRIHTWEQFLESVELVNHYFSNWNVDIMSALPGQSLASYQKTINQVLACQPPHISSYSLIIEEGTPFYERYHHDEERREHGNKPQILPDEETERQMYEMTGEQLEHYGYRRYEISNFAKEGYECQHNNRYWKREDYLGFGLGAASCMNQIRFKNTTDMKKWLKTDFSKEEIQRLTIEEQMEETMFLGLRRMEGVNKEDFYSQYQRTIEEVFGEVLVLLKKNQLLKDSGNYIQLTQKGIDVSNYVFAQFLLEER